MTYDEDSVFVLESSPPLTLQENNADMTVKRPLSFDLQGATHELS